MADGSVMYLERASEHEWEWPRQLGMAVSLMKSSKAMKIWNDVLVCASVEL